MILAKQRDKKTKKIKDKRTGENNKFNKEIEDGEDLTKPTKTQSGLSSPECYIAMPWPPEHPA